LDESRSLGKLLPSGWNLFIEAVASMVRPKITLYVDIVSPFAYLAYYTLRVRGWKPA